MSIKVLRRLVRIIISEEIGRNYHTTDKGPISYKDFADYDVDIIMTHDGQYILSVTHDGEKMAPVRKYSSTEEADLAARQMVDKHRLSQP